VQHLAGFQQPILVQHQRFKELAALLVAQLLEVLSATPQAAQPLVVPQTARKCRAQTC
jgi:hypothetical protein